MFEIYKHNSDGRRIHSFASMPRGEVKDVPVVVHQVGTTYQMMTDPRHAKITNPLLERMADLYRQAGIGMFVVGIAGLDGSEGAISRETVYSRCRTAFNLLSELEQKGYERLVLSGNSLGGFLATFTPFHEAKVRPPRLPDAVRGMIVTSPMIVASRAQHIPMQSRLYGQGMAASDISVTKLPDVLREMSVSGRGLRLSYMEHDCPPIPAAVSELWGGEVERLRDEGFDAERTDLPQLWHNFRTDRPLTRQEVVDGKKPPEYDMQALSRYMSDVAIEAVLSWT